MANIIVTRACNARCRYCFAGSLMAGSATPDAAPVPEFITMALFERLLDWVQRSGDDELRLLGGEPTLHPEFPALLGLAAARGLRVLLFSNGLMPKAAIAAIAALAPDRCRVVLNTDAGQREVGALHKHKAQVLQQLDERIVLGYTIYRLPLDLSPLLTLWDDPRWHLAPFIRLGIAHPIHQGGNESLHPKDYAFVGRRIAEFSEDCGRHGVSLQFDCGFVRCMFDDVDIGLLRANDAATLFQCRPIIDIGPGGQAVHCFALANDFRLRLDETTTLPGLHDDFVRLTRAYRPFGVYRACSVCPQKREGHCDGGCLARRLDRLRVPFRDDHRPGGES